MAKKFGKFLLFTAAVGAVAAGAYYYLKNKEQDSSEDLDDLDDLDDFSEDDLDLDSSEVKSRSYVSLDLETPNPIEKVEEFFDDDDDTDDTSLDSM